MLGIVIPLKSSVTSSCWENTSRSLIATLKSVLNQNEKSYQVIVVGHERPLGLDNLNLNIDVFYSVSGEFPPPPKINATQEQFTSDKNCKISKGIELLKQRYPNINIWFALDADDLIEENLVRDALKALPYSLFSLDMGYMYYGHANRVIETQELTQYCGSTGIIHDDYLSFDVQGKLVSCPFLSQSHMGLSRYFKQQPKSKVKTSNRPFVMYSLGHGENISDGYRNLFQNAIATIKPYVKGKALSAELKKSFGIIEDEF